MGEVIESPPMCFFDCEDFIYKKDSDEHYICKVNCMQTNDLFEMWQDCPWVHKEIRIQHTLDNEDFNNDLNQLKYAYDSIEAIRQNVIGQLDKVQNVDGKIDEKQMHLLINYKLELLDVKLRLKDFIEHWHLINWD